jgi:hypothetical protein
MNNADNHNLHKSDVMPRYYYQDGSEVKENDIVFYSEDGGDHGLHYADSIGIIVKRENDLKMKAYVITMDDAKTFQDYEEPEHSMVSLKYGCENFYPWSKKLPNTLQHFTKIGEYPKDENMLTAEFAMERYVYNVLKTIEKIKQKLILQLANDDQEEAHLIADDCICEILGNIGYSEIVEIYKSIPKWHA